MYSDFLCHRLTAWQEHSLAKRMVALPVQFESVGATFRKPAFGELQETRCRAY